MVFKSKEIRQLAELSKLKLTEEEELKYGEQLSSILEYVKILDEIDLDDKKIASLLLETKKNDLKNVWREDKASSWNEEESKLALGQGEIENSYLKVKKVL